MKIKQFILAAAMLATTALSAQEFKVITTVESVVPGGLGRSRMIEQSNGSEVSELKMNNFFSMTGINFGNIVDNDKMIADMLARMTTEGWELITIVPGVYAADKSTGIFICRYFFKK